MLVLLLSSFFSLILIHTQTHYPLSKPISNKHASIKPKTTTLRQATHPPRIQLPPLCHPLGRVTQSVDTNPGRVSPYRSRPRQPRTPSAYPCAPVTPPRQPTTRPLSCLLAEPTMLPWSCLLAEATTESPNSLAIM